jgi:hypothetical protein
MKRNIPSLTSQGVFLQGPLSRDPSHDRGSTQPRDVVSSSSDSFSSLSNSNFLPPLIHATPTPVLLLTRLGLRPSSPAAPPPHHTPQISPLKASIVDRGHRRRRPTSNPNPNLDRRPTSNPNPNLDH